MRSGIFEVTFYQDSMRHADLGGGIVTIKDGAMNGGDQAYVYFGTLTYGDTRLTGRIQVKKWSLATGSVFAGLDNYELDLTADFTDESIDGWGTVVGRPDLTLHVSAHRVSDAA